MHYVPDDAVGQQKKLDELAKCNCCATHQLNKPRIYAPWVEISSNKNVKTRISNTNEDGTVICNCKCRLKARFICREHYDYNASTIN
jgi:hypothetical protein